MVCCEVIDGHAENATLWELLFAFPFPNGIGHGDGPCRKLLESVRDKRSFKFTVSGSRNELRILVEDLFTNCLDIWYNHVMMILHQHDL